jgi:hypothetical protein
MSASTFASPDGRPAAPADLRNLEKVRAVFASLGKYVSAQAIYQSNNPSLIKFANAFEQAFRSFFESENELILAVQQYRMVWRDQVVYDIGCNTESLAFLLFKDGIGEISILSTVKKDELEQFACLLKNALYSPAVQFDTATALWNAEFPNIFYRVLDEQSDGADGAGDGSGSSRKEEPLRANDHQNITTDDTTRTSHHSDALLENLGTYLDLIAEQECRRSDPAEKERRLQRVLADHFAIDTDALARWKSATRATHENDDLIAFLRIMFDFMRARSAPPVVRDITDTVERLVHYIRDEGHVTTLIATLELPGDILRYLHIVGEKSVPALCELMARSTDPSLHEKGCATLIDVAGADILRIIETLDVSNPYLAQDVVDLMSRSSLKEIPPVIDRMIASSDPNIRRCVVGCLVHVASEAAAERLTALLKDGNQSVRVKTTELIVTFPHPVIIAEVTAICFSEEAVFKPADELERLFRALGKLAGESALPQIRNAIERKYYLPSGKSRSKRDKLLAVTALRYIPGQHARGLLDKLSTDADNLVRTKALHMLKQLGTSGTPSGEWSGEHPARRKS